MAGQTARDESRIDATPAHVFDVGAAMRVARAITPHTAPVTLDFSDVIEVHMFALAFLATRIRRGHVSIRHAREPYRRWVQDLGLEGSP
jgi:hypothetical protein